MSQVHRFNISGLVRRVSGGAAGTEQGLTRELLCLRGGVWLWFGTAMAAMTLGLSPVFQHASPFISKAAQEGSALGIVKVLTDLWFCTSSFLPTQTAAEQAGTLHLFLGEVLNAVQCLRQSS